MGGSVDAGKGLETDLAMYDLKFWLLVHSARCTPSLEAQSAQSPQCISESQGT